MHHHEGSAIMFLVHSSLLWIALLWRLTHHIRTPRLLVWDQTSWLVSASPHAWGCPARSNFVDKLCKCRISVKKEVFVPVLLWWLGFPLQEKAALWCLLAYKHRPSLGIVDKHRRRCFDESCLSRIYKKRWRTLPLPTVSLVTGGCPWWKQAGWRGLRSAPTSCLWAVAGTIHTLWW